MQNSNRSKDIKRKSDQVREAKTTQTRSNHIKITLEQSKAERHGEDKHNNI